MCRHAWRPQPRRVELCGQPGLRPAQPAGLGPPGVAAHRPSPPSVWSVALECSERSPRDTRAGVGAALEPPIPCQRSVFGRPRSTRCRRSRRREWRVGVDAQQRHAPLVVAEQRPPGQRLGGINLPRPGLDGSVVSGCPPVPMGGTEIHRSPSGTVGSLVRWWEHQSAPARVWKSPYPRP